MSAFNRKLTKLLKLESIGSKTLNNFLNETALAK